MDDSNLRNQLRMANNLANLQHPASGGQHVLGLGGGQGPPDPYLPPNRISQQDLAVFKERFPMLQEFSDSFLQSRTMDELLRIESTSLRIKDVERSKETEERLASNKSALPTKFYNVVAGRDNRWDELHPARFLPGAACAGPTQYIRAREVWGLSSPPPVGCYDMNCVGMGGFVQNKGWLELGTYGSSKLKVELFNINNAAKSSSVKQQEADFPAEMKDVGEFELALRTMRSAAQFAAPWNYSFLALENFLYQKKFFKDELQNDENPARTLCQFSNFILGENANHWRDGKGFLTPNDLSGYWSSFVGARPQVKLTPPQPAVQPKPQKAEPQKAQGQKRKYPFVDICGKYNVGNCQKPQGTCFNFRGILLRHVCNWRDPNVPNAPPCGGPHMRAATHP